MFELRVKAPWSKRIVEPGAATPTGSASREGRGRSIARPLFVFAAALLIALGTRVAPIVGDTRSGSRSAAPIASTGSLVSGQAGTGDPAALGSGSDAAVPTDPMTTLDAAIATWSEKAGWDANDYISATTLGGLYLQRARLTANLDDYERARMAAERSIAADPGYESGQTLEASVLFAIHDFHGALDTSNALLAHDPANLQALATAADATLELGDLATAAGLYSRLAAKAQGPAIDARLAHFAYLRGDTVTAMVKARAAGNAAVADPSITGTSFYEYQLGETARLTGDATLARQAYEAALAARPNDLGSLVGLARIDAFDGHIDDAIAGLRHAAAIAPQPDTLALLGDLLASEGRSTEAAAQYATVRTIAQLSALAGSVYDRQLLLFELDHGGATSAVLDRAVTATKARPDAAGHDVVAWAAYRLGLLDQASQEEDLALASGIRDARILFHAGAIDLATGQAARGQARLEQALALGPALDPLSRAEAQRLLGR